MKNLSETGQLLEAILFLENEAISIDKLSRITSLTELDVSAALNELGEFYASSSHGIELSRIGEDFQLVPKKHLWPELKERYGKRIDRRLTKAALETLSIIAYSQPITRKEIDSIRGVSSDSILRLLKEKELIKISGYKEGLGRPALYSTTKKFLQNFNLSSISSLPRLSEIDQQRFLEE